MRKTIKINDAVIVLDKIVSYDSITTDERNEIVNIKMIGGTTIGFVVDDADEAVRTITDAIDGRLPDYWDGEV